MGREIKFRVWTGKEMITPPNECIGSGSSAEIIQISIAGHISTRNAYGFDGFSKNPTFDEPITDYKLMQFTGLKDKNGIDIYEGDIIKTNQLIGTYTVKFKKGCFGLQGNNDAIGINRFSKNNSFHSFHYMSENNSEVIGNIHQNTELLNQ